MWHLSQGESTLPDLNLRLTTLLDEIYFFKVSPSTYGNSNLFWGKTSCGKSFEILHKSVLKIIIFTWQTNQTAVSFKYRCMYLYFLCFQSIAGKLL